MLRKNKLSFDLLSLISFLTLQVRHRYGLYDEITYAFGRKVRNCNWVRFLRVADNYGPQVNVVCTKISGEVIYEVVKPIPIHHELIVFYMPERPEELFLGRMKNTFYRRTMDSILEGKQLIIYLTLMLIKNNVEFPISKFNLTHFKNP